MHSFFLSLHPSSFFFHQVRNQHNLNCTKMHYAPPQNTDKCKHYLQPLCLVRSLSSIMYCSYLQKLIWRIIVVWSITNSLNSLFLKQSHFVSSHSLFSLSFSILLSSLRHRTRSRYCRSCKETGPLRGAPGTQQIREWCIIQHDERT